MAVIPRLASLASLAVQINVSATILRLGELKIEVKVVLSESTDDRGGPKDRSTVQCGLGFAVSPGVA